MMTGDTISTQDLKDSPAPGAHAAAQSFNAVFDQYRNPPANERTIQVADAAQTDMFDRLVPSPNSRPANSNLRPGERPHVIEASPAAAAPDLKTVTPDQGPVIMAPPDSFGPQSVRRAPDQDAGTRATAGPFVHSHSPSPAPGAAPENQASGSGLGPGSDRYFQGDRSTMGGLGYTIHAGIDLAAIGAGAVTANKMVNQRFGDDFVRRQLKVPAAVENSAIRDMEVLIRRVGAPELNSLTKQYGETFSKMGVNIKDATSLYRMSENTLTPAENEARLHMAALQRSTVTPGSIKWAEDTAQTPELKGLVTRGAENLAQASAERESASLAATAVRNAMRGGSAIALGVGEVANVGMDYTLFSGTPHSLRTAAMDAAAAFVVLTPLAARWKLAAVVGTHIVNRIWDANSKDVGKI